MPHSFFQVIVPDERPVVEKTPVFDKTPVMVNVNTQEATAASVLSTKESLQEHISSGQVNAVTFLCQKLGISASDLLSEDIRSHPEFMRALSSLAASSIDYFSLVALWKKRQSFKKSGSVVSKKYQKAESNIQELTQSLKELSSMKILTGNLGAQLKSCQDKLNKMLGILPVLFNTKSALEGAIDSLKPCVRAQKARQLNSLTANSEYKLITGNALGLTWENAVDKLSEMET